jgi:hypothetical protein
MRRLRFICFCLTMSGWLVSLARGQAYIPFEFDGQKVMGRPAAFKDSHIQIALQTGGLTNVAWGRLSQATLEHLVRLRRDPIYAPYAIFAQPFINPPPQAPPQGPRVTVRDVQRMERPLNGSLFDSPVMFLVFFLLYLANIYAGYEVAVYRHRNPGLVACLSALVPVLIPVIYLAIPSPISEAAAEEAATEEGAGEEALVESEAAPEAAEEPAAAVAEEPAQQAATVYRRGQFTFNRRFFETKLAGFLKMVPGEAEKDMVIVVISSRGTFTGPRLKSVGPNDLTLHVVKANASSDVSVPFAEISEVKVRHKDAA